MMLVFLLTQQLFYFCRDNSSFCLTGKDFCCCTHDFTHILRSCCSNVSYNLLKSCLKLLIAHLLWKILFDNCYLSKFSVGQVCPSLLSIYCSRVFALF